MTLYELIIPYRSIRNSRYPGGLKLITTYPYIYLIIYNADDNDTFDPSIINSTYDNNIDVPPFALFQLPTTKFTSGIDNFYLSSESSSLPKIRFTPKYYNLIIKITDDRGNIIYFDNIPKESETDFNVVPDSLLNVTLRLGFKKI